MMLNHLGETGAAEKIKSAYNAVLAEARPETLTRDLGGTAGTNQFADALIERIMAAITPPAKPLEHEKRAA